MRRKKVISDPVWLTWEGDDFPRKFHSDSVVFFVSEHIYIDDDAYARRALAKALLQEGISFSTPHSFRLIDSAWSSRAGYRYEDGDERYPVYCENDDPLLDYDATFVEVAYVD
jgi:hypothetical protein